MIIFNITPWWPTESYKIGGIFIKEYLEKYKKIYSEDTVILSSIALHKVTIRINPKAFFFSFINNESVEFYEINGIQVASNKKNRLYSPLSLNNRKLQLYRFHKSNLDAAIKKFGPMNLIHSHHSPENIEVVSKLSEEYKIPFITTEHFGQFASLPEFSTQKLSAYKTASKIITVSNANKQIIQNKIGCYVSVIPNLVNTNIFYKNLSITKFETFTFILIASTLAPSKGTEVFLRAFSLLKNTFNFNAIIGGSKVYLNELKELAKTLGIFDRITWHEQLSKEMIARQINKCHCFVLPSFSESFGIVLIEAAACGIPIISTRCGGPEDIVNNSNGILVNVGNPQEVKEAMLSIYSKYSQYESSKIISSTLEKFSPESICQQYKEIYLNLNKYN